AAVDVDVANSLVSELRELHEDRLRELWVPSGVLVETEDATEEAPGRVSLEALRERWGRHCVCMESDGAITPTCFYSCKTGHCPHKYSVENVAGIKDWVGTPAGGAKVGAAELRRREKERRKLDKARARVRAAEMLANSARLDPDEGAAEPGGAAGSSARLAAKAPVRAMASAQGVSKLGGAAPSGVAQGVAKPGGAAGSAVGLAAKSSARARGSAKGVAKSGGA
ncbi:unnamed protein product, partial [Prorocentrum cordatum]